LGIGRGLNTNSYLELSGRLRTQAAGGFAFDAYGPEDFKFVYADARTGQVVIGHRTAKGGWAVDAAVSRPVAAGADFDLGVSLKGSTASVTVNGQPVVGHSFNAVVVDGRFGVLTRGGSSSFDKFRIKTNDPAFQGPNGLQAAAVGQRAPGRVLTERALAPIVREAVRRWTAAGVPAASLAGLRIAIADLPGSMLGQAQGSTVYIDRDAAGHGWFIDRTPRTDTEFLRRGNQGELGRIDLLTAVMHEIGHVLGHDHDPAGVMGEVLEPGERKVPVPALAAPPAVKVARGGSFLSRVFRR
jgi:hypothetical protein